uniref:Amine oxidase domain-containing protein n=1 Tax=Aegilops tauschii subsp. strangulata TaxID=200361 RepID=A0A453SEP7_AEGTS
DEVLVRHCYSGTSADSRTACLPRRRRQRPQGHHSRRRHVRDLGGEAAVGRRGEGPADPGGDGPRGRADAQAQLWRAQRGDRRQLGGGPQRGQGEPHLAHGQRQPQAPQLLLRLRRRRRGGLYDEEFVQKRMDRGDEVEELGGKLAAEMDPSGRDDISILAMQRLFNHQPNGPATPVDMVLDYFRYDYEFAEPPRVTSLQGTEPTATFADFGDDANFVADQRGFETLIYHIAGQYLRSDKSGNIVDPRVKLNKVVREISYDQRGVVVTTEDNSAYSADYVIVSASIGVLQSDLIQFKPQLPAWKILAIYRFDMGVYTKIFLKFPRKFWPTGPGKQFFVYASSRRGYYGMWQSFEQEYPGANVLMVTVTDVESRRIEQQPDNVTMAEAVGVLRNMFPDRDVPDATDIYVPRWWSNRFFKGSYSNWPVGVNRYEYDQLRAPVGGRVYFTGEHTSEHYNGYVHGAYLAGIDSADILMNKVLNNVEFKVRPKYDEEQK